MVNLTTFTSSPTSESLKCFVCENYLSYFPISLCSNNKSVCGRCTTPEDLVSYKNEVFEEICQHFQFPCRFKNEGCPEECLPKDTPKHEKKCSFRVVGCIITKPEECQWQGSLPDLLRHCKKQHSDLILENREFEMDPNDAEERDNLILVAKNVLLVFRRKYDPKSKKLNFVFSFGQFGSFKSYSCQLSVKNDKTSVMFDFESSEGILKVKDLSLEPLYSRDEPDMFLARIIILPESKKITGGQHSEINSELLKFLRCGWCKGIAKPPVFHCTNDISVVCSVCKKFHSQTCSLCNNSPVSNIHFGEILKFVQYPCKYKIKGCRFSSKYDILKIHQVYCEYRPIICPFAYSENACSGYKFKKDLCSHILKTHEDRIGKSEEIYELSLKKFNTTLMRCSRHLFVLFCRFEDEAERCVWSLQKIGNFDTKYKFEVEIVNEALGSKVLVGTQCSTFIGRDNILKDHNSCYIQKDQIKCWKDEVNKILVFKVRILKM